jgi:peptidoglycan/LPS O-acetylase OafA/YrhL
MLREEAREGRFSLLAFYVRRSLRILPPFAAFLAALAVLAAKGLIAFQPAQIINAAAFTCNTGLTECGWFVAHTWSLAVEEQYYLAWPLLFTLIVPLARHRFAATTTLLLVTAFVLLPWTWHSNSVSFACIAAGATCALQPRWREALECAGNFWTWSLAALFALLGPFLVGLQVVEAAMPALAVFLLFASRRVGLLRRILESAPFQWVGSTSYSLYLWQQLFLAVPASYSMPPPPVWLLPVVAWLSLVAIERPCMKLAHRISRGILQRRSAACLGDAVKAG